MADMHEIEIWMLINADGEYDVGGSDEEAAERFDESVGSGNEVPKRLVKIKLKVPVPRTVELTGVVPDESEGAELVVA